MLATSAILFIVIAAACREPLGPHRAPATEYAAYQVIGAELTAPPDADTYVSRNQPDSNFGAESTLRLDRDHRILIRWDSSALAGLVAGDSLISAVIELDITANHGGWGGQGRSTAIHRLNVIWEETEATWTSSMSPWTPGVVPAYASAATDTTTITNTLTTTAQYDVTSDVPWFLTPAPVCEPPTVCLPFVEVNGWVIKLENESGPASVDFGARESGSPPRLILTLLRQTPQVPAVAPDTFPADLFDASNLRDGSPCSALRTVRDVISVMFKQGATRGERQAAIDSTGGIVIGGISLGDLEGWYFVRVPDDGTGQGLCDARELLNSIPTVYHAGMLSLTASTFHRRPSDGPGWLKGEWSLDPFSVDGTNWGLEAIAAPLAWGCEIGRNDIAVAVVDREFHSASDMLGNIAPQWRGSLDMPDDTVGHGTRVASILAAPGDNDTTMSGVMWRTDLRPYDARVFGGTVFNTVLASMIAAKVAQAAREGARVINLSMGIGWLEEKGRLPVLESSDTNDVVDYRRALSGVLEQIAPAERPLIILAAGNDGISAFWAGFPAAIQDFPDEIVVVGASTINGTLLSGSNDGPLVQVVAPGLGVGALTPTGTVEPVLGGTSYAAPFVAGVAGLLKAFDPDLTAAQLKEFILEGAARGAASGLPTPGGHHLLNAYESLKRAAEREGAPLSGNWRGII